MKIKQPPSRQASSPDGATKAEIKLYEGNTHNPYISFSTSPNSSSNMIERMRINQHGNVGIGTPNPASGYMLEVTGKIKAQSITSSAGNTWSDFVFEESYDLPQLSQVEQYIQQHKHLPDIPSESEVRKSGINLAEMDAKLLQKIEELTLYLIEQNKQIEIQQQEIQELRKEINKLKK